MTEMTAFALPTLAIARGTKLHASNIISTSLLPPLQQRPSKRQRPPIRYLRMDSSEKEVSKPVSEKSAKAEREEDDDERLQRDPVYVYREFGKVSAVAVLIGLVLFFYDILISLWVTTIGLLYALAVLFEVKGADTLFTNILKASLKLWSSFTEGVRKGWNAVRTEVRKAMKDYSSGSN